MESKKTVYKLPIAKLIHIKHSFYSLIYSTMDIHFAGMMIDIYQSGKYVVLSVTLPNTGDGYFFTLQLLSEKFRGLNAEECVDIFLGLFYSAIQELANGVEDDTDREWLSK